MTRTVCITGATSGIGRATTLRLLDEGWQVIAAGLPADPPLPAAPQLDHLQLDLSDAASITAAAERITALTQAQGLHGLINNAGINQPAALELLSTKALRQHFEVNVIGHHALIQALLPDLRQAHGRIVNVSSLMGRVPMPLLGAYSMSKHALEALTDILRLELEPQGITVASVAMGAVSTPMTDGIAATIEEGHAQLTDEMRRRYDWLYAGMQRALTQQARQAVPVERVVGVILKALTAAKPEPRYTVDAPARGLMLMRRLAPDRVVDAILRRALGLKPPR